MENSKKLSEIPTDQLVRISGFDSQQLEIKFMEMGLIIGEKIHIRKKAPTGDPICIFVCNYTLSLRKEEAEKILVFPVIES